MLFDDGVISRCELKRSRHPMSSQCPISTCLQLMSRQYPMSSHVHAQYVTHLHRPYLDSTQRIKPVHSQFPISTANVKSEFYYPCSITITPLLPMSRHYTITTAHALSVHHPYHVKYKDHTSCLLSVSAASLASRPSLLPMFSQYTICTAYIQTA